MPPSFISPLRIDTHLHTNESKQQNGIVSFSSTAEFPFKADNHSIISYCVYHIEFISLIIMYCISTEMIITLSMVSLCHARVWHEIIFAEANKENRTTTTTTAAAAGKERRKKHTYTLKYWIETKITLMHPNFIPVSFKSRIKKWFPRSLRVCVCVFVRVCLYFHLIYKQTVISITSTYLHSDQFTMILRFQNGNGNPNIQ